MKPSRRAGPQTENFRSAQSTDCFPPDLVRFVVEMAGRDADLVGQLLAELGIGLPSEGFRPLPSGCLLNLGAALRLLEWELAGIVLHLEAGLPSADEAIRLAFAQAVPQPNAESVPAAALRLHEEVLRLMLTHFAWNGPLHLEAEVVLDLPDEEALTEAMAELLWSCRNGNPSGLANSSDGEAS